MKTLLKFLAFLFITFIYSDIYSQSIKLEVQFKKKYHPSTGSILESQLLVWGNSVKYVKNKNGKFQAKIEILQTILQSDKIISFKKYNLETEERTIITDIVPDLTDIQNFELKNGKYQINISAKDLNTINSNPVIITDSVEIKSLDKKQLISDIHLIKETSKTLKKTNFTKAGYRAIPKFNTFFTKTDLNLTFYIELYNLQFNYPDQDQFLLKYRLKNSNHKTMETTEKFRKINSSDVTAVLDRISLVDLPPGHYYLEIVLHNKNNKQITSATTTIQILDFPQPIVSANIFPLDSISNDSLYFFVQCLQPIANPGEKDIINSIRKVDSSSNHKQFLANFWIKRDQTAPFEAWKLYYAAAKESGKLFNTTVKQGFETDQGYVFLKYGAPNSVSKRDKEPNAYPYEIWHYYKAGKYNNKQFIFYNPHLNLNDYELIHSDVPGEIKDTKWQLRIQKRTNPLNNIDNTKGTNTYGGQLEELHQLPK